MQTDVKVYPLVSDLVFKHIFGYQKNAKFTSDLLESFYGLDSGTLKDIVITNSVKLDRDTVLNKRFERWVKLINANTLEELENIAQGDYIMEEVVEEMKLFSGKNTFKIIMLRKY